MIVKRELRVQNELAVLGAGVLSSFLASLLSAEGFQQEIMTVAGSSLRRRRRRKICILLPQLMRMHMLTLLADASHSGLIFLRYGDVFNAWDCV